MSSAALLHIAAVFSGWGFLMLIGPVRYSRRLDREHRERIESAAD